jgi:hypothetical protein
MSTYTITPSLAEAKLASAALSAMSLDYAIEIDDEIDDRLSDDDIIALAFTFYYNAKAVFESVIFPLNLELRLRELVSLMDSVMLHVWGTDLQWDELLARFQQWSKSFLELVPARIVHEACGDHGQAA